MEGSRVATVIPVESEYQLRLRAWVEANRRKVDKMSNGKLGYVYLPNTGAGTQGGYGYFTRYYFSQQDKLGVVLDERDNGGGQAADFMVQVMDRKLVGFFSNRVDPNRPGVSPGAGIWGPKVMVINSNAGSGGDMLPYMFRKLKLGPLVGTRTWGGLVATGTLRLMDNGTQTAPRPAFLNTDGQWAVENEGTPPDIEVEETPAEVIKGGDPQLERAVREGLKLLESYPSPMKRMPPYPIRAKRPGKTTATGDSKGRVLGAGRRSRGSRRSNGSGGGRLEPVLGPGQSLELDRLGVGTLDPDRAPVQAHRGQALGSYGDPSRSGGAEGGHR
jgi:tricorn protease